jgi:hypothetical protein
MRSFPQRARRLSRRESDAAGANSNITPLHLHCELKFKIVTLTLSDLILMVLSSRFCWRMAVRSTDSKVLCV